MGDYESSISIQASKKKIEAFVSDVSNLPKYLPTTKNAESQSDERVRVQGEARGHQYDSDGYFRMDKSKDRMEWGSDGENNYKGWLSFKGDDPTHLTVHITIDPPPQVSANMAKATGSQDETIQKGLDEALTSIKNHIEGRGGKVDSISQK